MILGDKSFLLVSVLYKLISLFSSNYKLIFLAVQTKWLVIPRSKLTQIWREKHFIFYCDLLCSGRLSNGLNKRQTSKFSINNINCHVETKQNLIVYLGSMQFDLSPIFLKESAAFIHIHLFGNLIGIFSERKTASLQFLLISEWITAKIRDQYFVFLTYPLNHVNNLTAVCCDWLNEVSGMNNALLCWNRIRLMIWGARRQFWVVLLAAASRNSYHYYKRHQQEGCDLSLLEAISQNVSVLWAKSGQRWSKGQTPLLFWSNGESLRISISY